MPALPLRAVVVLALVYGGATQSNQTNPIRPNQPVKPVPFTAVL